MTKKFLFDIILSKKSHVIFIMLLLISFTSNSQEELKKMLKKTPEANQMLQTFNDQEHQLSFSACQMTYNQKEFKIGMSINELRLVLGKENFISKYNSYIWSDIGIVFSTDKDSDKNNPITDDIRVYFNDIEKSYYTDQPNERLYIKEDFILIEGVPIDRNMTVKYFLENIAYKPLNYNVFRDGYSFWGSCEKNKTNSIVYVFYANGGWLYAGGGHMRFRDKVNTNNKNTIRYIEIKYSKENINE